MSGSESKVHDPMVPAMEARAAECGLPAGALFERVIAGIGEARLGPGMTAIDVGAHGGLHAVPFARRVGWRGRVEAFEPIPALVRKLKRKRLIHLLPQLHIHPQAVGNRAGEVRFTHFRSFPEYSGILRRDTPFEEHEGEPRELVVPVTRLDDHLSGWPRVKLIKLDIEGGEFDALRGARHLLERDRPLVIFECGLERAARLYGYDAETFFEFFAAVRYRLFTLGGRSFDRPDWDVPHAGWNFVASPEEETSPADFLAMLSRRILES